MIFYEFLQFFMIVCEFSLDCYEFLHVYSQEEIYNLYKNEVNWTSRRRVMDV